VLGAFETAQVITSEQLERAKILLDYYLAEWRDLHGRLGALDPQTQKPRALLEWLREKHPGTFRLQDCYQKGPRVCGRDADSMKAHLSVLVRRGYVRPCAGNTYELRPSEQC